MNLRFTIRDLRAGKKCKVLGGFPPFSGACLNHAKTQFLVNRKSKIVNQRAFTMLEIAISIAVVAFALVAIIGVLPTGLRSQQETREQTIVNQDGPYFLEMIRNGAHGFDHLTNFVEWIQISNRIGSVVYTNPNFPLSLPPGKIGDRVGSIDSGEIILLALSTPKYIGNGKNVATNTVSAYVHSLSGAAVEKGRASRDLGFGYLLTSEVIPFASDEFTLTFFAPDTIRFTTNNNSPSNLERSNRWLQAQQMAGVYYDPTNANFFEVRLSCRWPLRPDFTTGRQRQVYRTSVCSTVTNVDIVGVPSIFPPTETGDQWLPGFYFRAQQIAHTEPFIP